MQFADVECASGGTPESLYPALPGEIFFHIARVIHRTLPTIDSDPADATRGYPLDSTDEANSPNQIAF